MKSYTQTQVYRLIYSVIKLENLHLGVDKASRTANQYAVKATWKVYNNRTEYLEFISRHMTILSILSTKD
jgi:hypothetical protein